MYANLFSGIYGNLLNAIQNGAKLGPATNFFICTDQTLEYLNDPSMFGPIPGTADDEMALCMSSKRNDRCSC